MVYVDKLGPCLKNKSWSNKSWKRDKSCHMFADSIEELKIFAVKIGLAKSWFQNNNILPHFDLTEGMRKKAVSYGAIEISDKDFTERLRRRIKK